MSVSFKYTNCLYLYNILKCEYFYKEYMLLVLLENLHLCPYEFWAKNLAETDLHWWPYFKKKKKKRKKKKTLNIAHVTRMSFSDIYCLLHSLLVLVIEKPADKFLDHVWMEKRLKWRWDAYCGNVRRRDGERGFSTPVENKTPQKKISTDTFDFRRFPKGPATCIHFRPWPP